MLTAALIGLPQVGKTTLFRLFTGSEAAARGTSVGRKIVDVPDERLERLAAMFRPKKVTPAQIEVLDLPPLVRGAREGQGFGNRFLSDARTADALIQVLRAFTREDVPHAEGSLDPCRDAQILDEELLFADLEVVDRRVARLEQGKKRDAHSEAELALLRRCRDALLEGRRIADLGLGDEERRLLRGYALLTQRPVIWAVNGDEGVLRGEAFPGRERLMKEAEARGIPVLLVSAQLEEEIARLAPEDRRAFLLDLGVPESGIERLARTAYRHLGLISFLTAGEDEVRAWTIPQGATARTAAGKIHSDMERGFIRAEVVSFDDLVAAGSLARARERGKVRLEGRDYVVRDGDVITFRFNVGK